MALEEAFAPTVGIEIEEAPAVTSARRAAAPARTSGEETRIALLTAPILPTLFKLALPTVIVLLAQTAVNIAEAYYVGYLGTDALAGAALVFPIFMLMTMMSNGGLGSGVASSVARAVGAGRHDDADALVFPIFMLMAMMSNGGLGSGVASSVARAVGARRHDDANALVFHAVVLAIVVGALFTAGTILGGPKLYAALGGKGEALKAAVTYSNYLFAGSIPVWIVNFQAGALRGSGNVRVPAIVTLVGALVMIPLSPILIFGFGPFPRLGIGGAGIAFALYYGAAMLVLLRYMASGRSGLTFRVVPLSGKLFADILKVGIPTSVNAVLANLTVILVTGAVGLFGTSALAGYGIASRLDYIMIPLLFGISTATLTMVGVNMGAGQTARARQIGWTSGIAGMVMTGTIGLVVAVFPTAWLNLFSHDTEVVREGTIYLRIVAPAYAALGFGFVVSFAAQGTGRALWPLAASSARILIAAGCGWIAVSTFGAGMAELATMVTLSLIVYAAICSIIMLSSRVWRPEED